MYVGIQLKLNAWRTAIEPERSHVFRWQVQPELMTVDAAVLAFTRTVTSKPRPCVESRACAPSADM